MSIMRLGSTLTLNSTALNGQFNPSIATLSDGRIIATWWSNDTDDGSESCIKARIFNADMTPVGNEFIVNVNYSYGQYYSSVAALTNGGFAIAWYNYDNTSSARSVRVRVFDNNGTSITGDLLSISGVGAEPSITGLTSGGFVVAHGTDNSVNFRVHGANGSASTGVINVASGYAPSVTPLNDGRFVVSWWSVSPSDGSGSAVYAQIFSTTGVAQTPVRQINVTIAGDQTNLAMAELPDGRIVAAWTSADTADGSGSCIRIGFYNSDLTVLDSDWFINQGTTGAQREPRVCVLPDGRFLVAWVSDHFGTGAGTTIRGMMFRPDGIAISDEFGLNTEALSVFYNPPGLAVTADGRILVTWDSATVGDGSAGAARAAIFDPDTFIMSSAGEYIVGSDASETFYGGQSFDIVSASGGADTIFGQLGDDLLFGNDGDDFVSGDLGDDHIDGANGNDVLSGGDGNDVLTGGMDNDILIGGRGSDTFNGDDGYDIADYSTTDALIIINLATGSATGGAAGDTFDSVERFVGTVFDDDLFGNANANDFEGGVGNDELSGQGGNDTLFGGAGTDTLVGGSGLDVFGFRRSEHTTVSGDSVTDYSGNSGDVIRVMGGLLADISISGSGNSRALTVGMTAHTITLSDVSLLFLQWLPSESQTDLRNGIVRGYDIGGGYVWSVYTDYFNSEGLWTHQSGAYDFGSNAGGVYVHDVDETNTENYQWYRNEANAAGQTFSQIGLTDDGRGWVSLFSGGQTTQQSWTDNSGTRNWSSYADHYDATGNLDYQQGVYDSSLQWLQDYDQNNTQWFRYFRNEFTSNMMIVQQVGQKDDGTNWNSIFTNGQLSLVQWSDTENAYSWTRFTDILGNYAGGYSVHRIGMNDNGTTFDTYF